MCAWRGREGEGWEGVVWRGAITDGIDGDDLTKEQGIEGGKGLSHGVIWVKSIASRSRSFEGQAFEAPPAS